MYRLDLTSHRSLLSPAGKNPDAPRRDRASAEIPNGNVSICLGVLPWPDLAWRSSLALGLGLTIALATSSLLRFRCGFGLLCSARPTDSLQTARPRAILRLSAIPPSGEAISHSQIYTRRGNITHGAISSKHATQLIEHLIGRAARTTWAGAQSQSQRPGTAWAGRGS